MGRLCGPGGVRFMLGTTVRVGRSSENELALSDASVSQFHAVLRWVVPGKWELCDLGSRNGTFLDGERLASGERRELERGAVLRFGNEDEWALEDDGRPFPEVRDLVSGARISGTKHLVTIEGPGGTTADILEDGPGQWQLELDGVVTDVAHDQVITVDGRPYRLGLPLPAPETEEARLIPTRVAAPLHRTSLTFLVSSDLETIRLSVTWDGGEWSSERAYNRALLALAEARLRDDAAARLAAHDRGWLYGDELCSLADYESVNRLNVEIHRARVDLARQGIPGAPAIVQRRRGTGQLRLGTSDVEVRRGGGA